MVALRGAVAAVWLAAAACATSEPVDVRPGDACAYCRMAVSNARFAAQIVVPGEEPEFYDDIGCLSRIAGSRVPDLAHAYVADHRTGAWVRADAAVYTHVPSLSTPMGSGIVAHADDASRRADAAAAAGKVISFSEVLSGTAGGGQHGR